MEASRDAFGLMLLDHLEGRPAVEIVERDDGFVQVFTGSPAGYFAPVSRWHAPERRALRLVRGRVLDVGCGAGRVALELGRRGHDVVAVDPPHSPSKSAGGAESPTRACSACATWTRPSAASTR